MKKSHSESISDYIIWAENTVTALNAVDKAVSDSLLVVIVLKGLPEDYTPFVAVITQQERIHNFQKFKQLFRNFEKIKNTRINERD